MKNVKSEPVRILFLCTHNAARSQIAEALLRRKARGEYVVMSAGTDPADAVHPQTIEVLARVGVDWSRPVPKHVNTVADEQWDLVITVCDKSREQCPTFRSQPVTADWSLPDPADVSPEHAASAFWETLNVLSRRIDLLVALGPDRLRDVTNEEPAPVGGQ